ncbi:MAG: MBL fold metallo-hydrolase [Bacteroides sp.]|nr:MBL fold metallo-hydrolase [Bacteroides sp.]MCM1413423.1 MBL fold metallo-hydrolase [Bacteroides sp.]MCM1471366.1 MBL fold metallo-hydrolase [Bacteroides sp.]
MKYLGFQFNPFSEVTYLIWDKATGEGAVIDPGMSNIDENEIIDSTIEDQGIKLKYQLFTHLHVDHTFGYEHIAAKYGLKATAHPDDDDLGLNRGMQAKMFGLPLQIGALEIGHLLNDNDTLKLGNEVIRVICVPGHSRGSVAYYLPGSKMVFTGDALFQGSIGRTDLPGGNHKQLIDSITRRLLTLPDDTVVFPGHGPSTTIMKEKRSNPFL